ncbi:helix-turn-helix domain-containing protein [Sulfuracidifex tepidarius]|uniref:HTH cro/C1-type domain-containing protein n=1 Tax=Sulfuracidifex tepidarius TaxID=1294262 RepID=A0A510E5S3_9CREN|nr:helix-turn-helix transcriptional regulator [Sulfuracidifex tepidarius]BBG24610.1 hypothetical protein IC006_1939 [Sulfuracidifex tepidarius]BBG27398.1 hypothetical protein IC007_1947 [Sulfuracidifex tepidarius]
MERIFHNLSKDARIDIISLLLERRGKKELALELGVSPALITKYINNVTHPSDTVLKRAYSIAQEDERRKINDIILNDLSSSLLEFLENVEVSSLKDNKDLKKLMEVLKEAETNELLSSFGFV